MRGGTGREESCSIALLDFIEERQVVCIFTCGFAGSTPCNRLAITFMYMGWGQTRSTPRSRWLSSRKGNTYPNNLVVSCLKFDSSHMHPPDRNMMPIRWSHRLMSQILVPSKAAEDGVFKRSSDCGGNICK